MPKAVANLIGRKYVPQLHDDEGNVVWEADACDTHEEAIELAEAELDAMSNGGEEEPAPSKSTRSTSKKR